MIRAMKDSGIEWIGKIPQDWNVRKLKWCFYQKKAKASIENPTILSLARDGIKVRDISTNEGQLAADYTDYNPVESGDLLLNPMDLYSGDNCNISKISGVISPAYVNLRTLDGNVPEFYNYYFKVQYWTMAFFAHGKGVSYENRWTLTNETLRNYPIVLPSTEKQQIIADYLDKKCGEIDKVVETEKAVIEKLKEYKQSVITEAVTKGLDKSVSLKDSGIEWIGIIPEHWSRAKLKIYSSCIGDGLHGTPEYSDNGEFYFINGNNIGLKRLVIKENTSRLNRNEAEKYFINLNDRSILISLNGTVGNTSRYNQENIILSKSAGYINLKDNINIDFVEYWLHSSCTKLYFELSFAGTTIKNLSLETLRNLYIALPPLKEQQQIADYLDKKCSEIDQAIAYKEQVIEKFTEYKKSLIYECVTGKKEVA